MAFTTRRGRPPSPKPDATDLGTPELRFKHAHGLTMEPIDRCLQHQLITPTQHWCGLHLRWLYTLRYGAPNLTSRYVHADDLLGRPEDDPLWRTEREAEYHTAIALLTQWRYYEPVMRLCVYNEHPVFLHAPLRQRAWDSPAIAEQLNLAQRRLTDGLELLVAHWKRNNPG